MSICVLKENPLKCYVVIWQYEMSIDKKVFIKMWNDKK